MAIALVVTLLMTPLVKRLAIKMGAVDDPTKDDRRVHTKPVPRWGGLAIYAGFLVALVIVLPIARSIPFFPPYVITILVLGALLVVFGAIDDLKQLSAKWQLLFLVLVGVAVQSRGTGIGIQRVNWHEHSIQLGAWGVLLTVAYIFVITKTMDTIDGIDGLAAGIAAIAASTLCIIAVIKGQPRVALIAAAAAGASIGFLRYNYNPAKIFMGTGGAQLLGFVLACLSIVGPLKTVADLALFIPLVFGVPIIDALVVIVRRVWNRQPITQADKRHIHHELLKRGLSQRQAVWVLYGIAMAMGALLITLVVSHV